MRGRYRFFGLVIAGAIAILAIYFFGIKKISPSAPPATASNSNESSVTIPSQFTVDSDDTQEENATPNTAQSPTPDQATSHYQRAQNALKENRPIDAIKLLATAYKEETSQQLKQAIKNQMISLNEQLMISRTQLFNAQLYQVQPGDSLWTIAKKFNVSPQHLSIVNQLTNDYIYPGQRLKILKGKFSIQVVKSEYKLYLLYEDTIFKEYTISIGKDNKTPTGQFKIAEKVYKPSWQPVINGRRVNIPYNDPRNQLGEVWIRFVEPSELGIHGTNDENSIGKPVTNGCIRMSNKDVLEVAAFVKEGADVIIVD